jgi:hypothetical protein
MGDSFGDTAVDAADDAFCGDDAAAVAVVVAVVVVVAIVVSSEGDSMSSTSDVWRQGVIISSR